MTGINNAADIKGIASTSFGTSSGIVVYNGTTLVNYSGPQISSSGVYTNTSQPAFFAYQNATVTNVTGDGTFYTVIFNSSVYDQASNYSTTTGHFTAPVTGKYRFSGCVACTSISSSMTRGYIFGNLGSGGLMTSNEESYAAVRSSNNNVNRNFYFETAMTAADTFFITITIENGSKAAGVFGQAGGAAAYITWMAGGLIN